MKREGVYAPRQWRRTSPDAVATIVELGEAGVSIPSIIDALNDRDLRPARSDVWRDSTVRRILARAGLSGPKLSDDARFEANTREDADCILWIGAAHPDGYGRFEVGGHHVLAHRWAFEREHGAGSIPKGWHMHHTCRRPACVRPDHLMPVAPEEHKPLEHEEAAINVAALAGALQTNAGPSDDGWPAWLETAPRIGTRRSKATS
jgi:hypothetical protein